MTPIIVLEENTANKIAAGEVVERPASVVKEMVENSLDAGATSIDIEIREGGKEYLRVVDNGRGIPPEEVPLAFERHATSKIRSADDLFRIITLGFRGEALPSIAAVSDLEMVTRTQGAPAATLIAFSGGKRTRLESVGSPLGTAVTVQRLFFNTPARYKFLNQAASERRHVYDIVGRLALANPRVRFRLVSDGEEIMVTPGDGNMEAVMWSIYGSRIGKHLIPVHRESSLAAVNGYICKPEIHRGNRQAQTFIINGRIVESSLLANAMEKGYQTMLPRRRYPIGVLALTLDPSRIDVNVHPTKREIRFSDSSEVYKQVLVAVRQALEASTPFEPWHIPAQQDESPERSSWSRALRSAGGPGFVQETMEAGDSGWRAAPAMPPIRPDRPTRSEPGHTWEPAGTSTLSPPEGSAAQAKARESDETGFPGQPAMFRILGQFRATYILVEAEDELWLIDQHAAHERILYERFLTGLQSRAIKTQALLVPMNLELGPAAAAAVLEWSSAFEELGFEVAAFGSKDCLVRSVPVDLSGIGGKDLEELLLGVINQGQTKDYREPALILMACKGAVKAGEELSPALMQELVTSLLSTRNPFTCPHGRPVIVRLALEDLHRRFGRS
ncbi:MAG: DNA mismatch repair endonuclease MutL [Firmicutes bacterium]|mgnify:CR=1 FL=1|jgi:DNA mismatch repair protein MutL|nr:DNA mismatch repair endonuclease MutL [Bacillota bacterium]